MYGKSQLYTSRPFLLQALAGLLPDATPAVAVSVFEMLEDLIRQPCPGMGICKPSCLALLDRKSVMEPLLAFCIRHATNTPVTALEWVSAWGRDFFSILWEHTMASSKLMYRRNHSWAAGR